MLNDLSVAVSVSQEVAEKRQAEAQKAREEAEARAGSRAHGRPCFCFRWSCFRDSWSFEAKRKAQAEEAAKKKEEAEKARAEEAAKRKAEEEKKKQEQEAKRQEEAKKREEAEKARAEEAAKRKAEEEEKKKEAEARGQVHVWATTLQPIPVACYRYMLNTTLESNSGGEFVCNSRTVWPRNTAHQRTRPRVRRTLAVQSCRMQDRQLV